MTTHDRVLSADAEPTRAGDERAGVFWHRSLPPLEAEMLGEHVLEATSNRVSTSLARRDEPWEQCYVDLMRNTEARLKQEINRLGGHYAHVLDESIDTRHDDATGEAWLHGRFTYVLYRRPASEWEETSG